MYKPANAVDAQRQRMSEWIKRRTNKIGNESKMNLFKKIQYLWGPMLRRHRVYVCVCVTRHRSTRNTHEFLRSVIHNNVPFDGAQHRTHRKNGNRSISSRCRVACVDAWNDFEWLQNARAQFHQFGASIASCAADHNSRRIVSLILVHTSSVKQTNGRRQSRLHAHKNSCNSV